MICIPNTWLLSNFIVQFRKCCTHQDWFSRTHFGALPERLLGWDLCIDRHQRPVTQPMGTQSNTSFLLAPSFKRQVSQLLPSFRQLLSQPPLSRLPLSPLLLSLWLLLSRQLPIFRLLLSQQPLFPQLISRQRSSAPPPSFFLPISWRLPSIWRLIPLQTPHWLYLHLLLLKHSISQQLPSLRELLKFWPIEHQHGRLAWGSRSMPWEHLHTRLVNIHNYSRTRKI